MSRKLILLIFVAFFATIIRAQVDAGFDSKDSDAWFDKEIYFLAYNNYVAYGYGQPIYNAAFVVDGKDTYYVNGVWGYGQSVVIDGTKMDKGTTVALYVNGQHVKSWVCNESNPSIAKTSFRLYKDYRMLKRIIKLAKKIR